MCILPFIKNGKYIIENQNPSTNYISLKYVCNEDNFVLSPPIKTDHCFDGKWYHSGVYPECLRMYLRPSNFVVYKTIKIIILYLQLFATMRTGTILGQNVCLVIFFYITIYSVNNCGHSYKKKQTSLNETSTGCWPRLPNM